MIGGKVLDASTLAAYTRGQVAIGAWVSVACRLGVVLYVPDLAVQEVRVLRPYSVDALADLLAQPPVVHERLAAREAASAEALLSSAGLWDGTAAHVLHVASTRGWPVLTADPGRLRRLDPDVRVEVI